MKFIENGKLDYEKFFNAVIERLSFQNASEKELEDFSLELFPKVINRVLKVLTRELGKQEVLERLNKKKEENSDISDDELIFGLVADSEDVAQKVDEVLGDLINELEENMEMVDGVIKGQN